MSNLAIEIENLSKKFKDKIVIDRLSLCVEKGETIGIIGGNGAGKSTLLRLLSGIIKPSDGTIRIFGTVTSILEVGNGFHPDLTGRENCFLSARLRGFSDKEIKAGMDHIISFSELEDSIDQLVKHYSNGMYLRLAFAVFERFNSDILLLDEVMSVGDAAFKQKTAAVMRKFKEAKKTIVMVSHNMNEIVNFCDRILYVSKGKLIDSKDIKEVVDNYLFEKRNYSIDHIQNPSLKNPLEALKLSSKNINKWKSDLIEMTSIKSLNDSSIFPILTYSQESEIELLVNILRQPLEVHLMFKIFDLSGNLIITTSTAFQQFPINNFDFVGAHRIKITLPASYLNKGIYTMSLLVIEGDTLNVSWDEIFCFRIVYDEWLDERPWSTMPSFILTELPTCIESV